MADILTLLALLAGLVFVVQSRAPPEELAGRVKEFVENLFRQDGPSDRERESWDERHRGFEDESAPIQRYAGENQGRRPQSPVYNESWKKGMGDDETLMGDEPGVDSDWQREPRRRGRERNREPDRDMRMDEWDDRLVRDSEAEYLEAQRLQSEPEGFSKHQDKMNRKEEKRRKKESREKRRRQEKRNPDDDLDNTDDLDGTAEGEEDNLSRATRSRSRSTTDSIYDERPRSGSKRSDTDSRDSGRDSPMAEEGRRERTVRGRREDLEESETQTDSSRLQARSKPKSGRRARENKKSRVAEDNGGEDDEDADEDVADGSFSRSDGPGRGAPTGRKPRSTRGCGPSSRPEPEDEDTSYNNDDQHEGRRGHRPRAPDGYASDSFQQQLGRSGPSSGGRHGGTKAQTAEEKADKKAAKEREDDLRTAEEKKKIEEKELQMRQESERLDELDKRQAEEVHEFNTMKQRNAPPAQATGSQSPIAAPSPLKEEGTSPMRPKQDAQPPSSDNAHTSHVESGNTAGTEQIRGNREPPHGQEESRRGERDRSGKDQAWLSGDGDDATLRGENSETDHIPTQREGRRRTAEHSRQTQSSSPTRKQGSQSEKPRSNAPEADADATGTRSAHVDNRRHEQTNTDRQEKDPGTRDASKQRETQEQTADPLIAAAKREKPNANRRGSRISDHEPSSPVSIADSFSDDSLYAEPKRQKESDKNSTTPDDTEVDCEQASPRSKKSVTGLWRSFKGAISNARTKPKRSILCVILAIGYVIMTILGAQYGRAGSSRRSSPTLARRQSLEESSSFGTGAVAATVSDAVSSATERIQSADLSLNGFQENLFAISMTWHSVVQFVVIWLISDVITPAEKKESKKKESKAAKEEAATDDDKVTFKQVQKALPRAIFRDIPALFYRFIKDSFKRTYRTVRRAKKWTYIRLALLAGLWLIMLLVARQLSSLAHIARDPSAKPWSSWPDATMLHDTLQANISGLATGERLVVASLCFWFVSITANVYCMSSFADRPAAVPADEEKALGTNEKVTYA